MYVKLRISKAVATIWHDRKEISEISDPALPTLNTNNSSLLKTSSGTMMLNNNFLVWRKAYPAMQDCQTKQRKYRKDAAFQNGLRAFSAKSISFDTVCIHGK